jgi:diamine N-acetyltransferase
VSESELVPPESCAPQHALTLHDKQGAAFQVAPYRPGDRALLDAFYRDFEPKRAAQGLPPFGEERIARWLDAILPQGLHLIACRAGELIGHAFVVPTEKAAGEYAVFLRQDERGRGVGTALNRATLDAARTAGYRRIWLSVAPHNRAAIRSYEKVGFRFRPGTIYSPEAEMELEL